MTNNNQAHGKKMPETLAHALKLLAVIALAFAAALVFRRSAGIIAMLPVAFLLCGAAAFIRLNPFLKSAVFGTSVFALNTIEQYDSKSVLPFVALCLLANAVAEISAAKLRKGKKQGYAIASVGAILCVCLSFLIIGNPFSAYGAQKALAEYTEKHYPESENAALGRFEFSSIYYRYDTRVYAIDAVSEKHPTESAMISVSDGVIRDGFQSLMEDKLREPYTLEFTAFLRKNFPKDSFSVSCESIAAMPDESIMTAEEGTLHSKLTYEIHLGGIQNAEDMLKRVEEYMNIIDVYGVEYHELVFKGGSNPWIRRCVRVGSGHQKFADDYKLEYVHAGTSDRFNKYMKSTLETE